MRRLLFNPLEQEPYASGVYTSNGRYFTLDKSLDINNKLYLICVHSNDYDGTLTFILFIPNIEAFDYHTNACRFAGLNGTYFLIYSPNEPKHLSAKPEDSTLDDFLVNGDKVYIYQLM